VEKWVKLLQGIQNNYNCYRILQFDLQHAATYTAMQHNILIHQNLFMSIFALAFPVQSAIPVAQAVAGFIANIARPLLGVSLVVTLLMIFKPLVIGILRAALLVLQPRLSRAERTSRRILRSVTMLNRMANELDSTQPSLAAEMRLLACRG
jgi:hypothetical protein